MKTKLFIYLLLMSILMTSCQQNGINLQRKDFTESEPTFTFIDDGNKAFKALEYLDIYMYSESKDMLTASEQQIWSDYIKKEMDIYVNLYYVMTENGRQMEGISSNRTDLSGLFLNMPLESQGKSAKEGILQYIEDYINLNKYPSDVANLITDIDGHVIILPVSHEKTYRYRTYNQDVLDELQADVPTTIEEFYELAKQISEKNKTSNRKTYIAMFRQQFLLSDLADIFIAFGLYPNEKLDYWTSSCIGLNPDTNMFEHMLYNENLEPALEYIKMLYDEGLLYQSKTNDYSDEVEVVSYLNEKNNLSFENNSYGLYLEGTNKKNLVYCSDEVKGFSFFKNTENMTSVISLFENMVFTDTKAQLAFQYGMEGDAYYIKDGVLFINNDSSIKKPGIKIDWYDPFEDTKYVVGGTVMENDKTTKEIIDEMVMKLDKEKLYQPDIYIDYYRYFSSEKGLYSMASKANRRFSNLVIDVFDHGAAINFAVDMYRERTINEVIIEDFNELIKTGQ